MQGILCQEKYTDPSAFERAHYIRTLRSYKQPGHPQASVTA
jgi:hypothetical protein